MDEKDNQAKEEKKPLVMSLIEAYGFVGWLFIGVGLYLCISWRMNYSSWGEYLVMIVLLTGGSGSLRLYYFLLDLLV